MFIEASLSSSPRSCLKSILPLQWPWEREWVRITMANPLFNDTCISQILYRKNVIKLPFLKAWWRSKMDFKRELLGELEMDAWINMSNQAYLFIFIFLLIVSGKGQNVLANPFVNGFFKQKLLNLNLILRHF